MVSGKAAVCAEMGLIAKRKTLQNSEHVHVFRERLFKGYFGNGPEYCVHALVLGTKPVMV